jgi:hypothetical protein
MREKDLLFLFLVGGGSGLRGLRLDHALLEFIDAPGGIDKFLRARVKRVADVADADQNGWLGGTGLDYVAAGATNLRLHIFGMYFLFHKPRPHKITAFRELTSANLRNFSTMVPTDVVAQISNLLYRRLQVGRALHKGPACGLEIRDTAGWKPALR